MIFEALWGSAQRGELLLVDGGYCRYHLRRDRQLTILEIISLRPGAGREMPERLCQHPAQPRSIAARCPANLPANAWYERRGFTLESVSETKTGRAINLWRLVLPPP